MTNKLIKPPLVFIKPEEVLCAEAVCQNSYSQCRY